MINVTRPYLPEKDALFKYIDEIYKSYQLTSGGKLLQLLEERLCEYLGVKYLVPVSNGTVALQLAYHVLDIKGEVITSPFTYVATPSSIKWCGIKPVFSDICQQSFNLDPKLITSHITPNTSAIVPIHVFGNPCDIKQIDHIAKKNNLKIIYDAAHCFGVKYKSKSILSYGNISTLSFHATKIYNTAEGGAVITNDYETYKKVKAMVNFGFDDNYHISHLGTNAKMSEFQAAIGLAILDNIDQVIEERKNLTQCYNEELQDVQKQLITNNSIMNYSYYPIVFNSEENLLIVLKALNEIGVNARRYFFPSLDEVDIYASSGACLNSQILSKKVLCLPLYPGLSIQELKKITTCVKKHYKNSQNSSE